MANISTDFSTWSATPASNQPDSLDTASIQADLQALQAALKIIFPNIGAALTPTHTELNYVDGVTSAIQTQLNAKAASGANSDITSLSGLTTPYAESGANSDITSLTALTAITAGAVTVAADDKVLIQDTSASDVLKTVTTQSIADLPIVSPTKTIGYGTGAGGTVTQATSKFTAVTLNKPCGLITMHNAALAAGDSVYFTLNNTLLASADVVGVTLNSYGSNYRVETVNIANGSVVFRVTNVTVNPLSESLVINFAIIKGANS